MTAMIKLIKSYLGLIAIAAAFIASAVIVLVQNSEHQEGTHIVMKGETLPSVAAQFDVTVERMCDENYPDIAPNTPLTPGMKIKLPREAVSKRITIRIAHKQLEPGVREGLNKMAREYERLHPNVRIVQESIPDATYAQWFVTQVVGNVAPDLLARGNGPAYPLLVSYCLRYFTPLTDHVMRPNPYNADNEFRDTALRDTIKDGFKNCYFPELQEYMQIGISQHLMRMMYNRTLLKKLTGKGDFSGGWGDFLRTCTMITQYRYFDKNARIAIRACEKELSNAQAVIASLPDTDGSKQKRADANAAVVKAREKMRLIAERSPRYYPVVNSAYTMQIADGLTFNTITSPARMYADFNHDCSVSSIESFIAFKAKKLDLNFGAYRARFQMIAQYASNSPPGYTGLSRDDAMLLFVQQRGVFMPVGTWDVNTVIEQAKDNGFEIGICDFPYPSPDDVDLYRYYEGPAFEDPTTSFAFFCATSPEFPERKRVAIDFLLFLTAKENNAAINRTIGWIPVVKGTEGEGILTNFQPHVDGVLSGMNMNIGGETVVLWQQLYTLYQTGQITFDEFRQKLEPFYLERGYKDYLTVTKDWRRSIAMDEKGLAVLRAKMFSAASRSNDYGYKYRYVLLRPVTRGIEFAFERSLMQAANSGMPIEDAYVRSASHRGR